MGKLAACRALLGKPIGEGEGEPGFLKNEKINSDFDLFWQKLKNARKGAEELWGQA